MPQAKQTLPKTNEVIDQMRKQEYTGRKRRTKRSPTNSTVELFEEGCSQGGDCSQPLAKKSRMHIADRPSGTTSRSVAERLKQSSLRDGPVPSTSATKQPLPVRHKNPEERFKPKQVNSIRLIAQYLKDLGLTESVEALVEESGLKVENAHAVRLREAILRGHWNDACVVLNQSFTYLTTKAIQQAQTIVLIEKFYYLLSRKEHTLAMRVLREEFPDDTFGMCGKPAKEKLVQMLFKDPDEVLKDPNVAKHLKPKPSHWRRKILRQIQDVLPPSFMLPTKRLEQLLGQAYQHQVQKCEFHTLRLPKDGMDPQNLFEDHHCGPSSGQLMHQKKVLRQHRAEVYCAQFSNSGKFLATGSLRGEVHIWKVDTQKRDIEFHKTLNAHLGTPYDELPVGTLSWSSDDRLLAACGIEKPAMSIWVFTVASGNINRYLRPSYHHSGRFTTGAFMKTNGYEIVAADMRGHMQLFDLSASDEHQDAADYDGYRVRCLYGSKDGTVYTADTHNRVRRFNFARRIDETLFTENSPITHMAFHPNERYCILTTRNHGLRIWDVNTCTLVRTLTGTRHGDLVIAAGIGGPNNLFCASGSDNGQVVLWSMLRSFPLARLKGHSGVVNGAVWHPVEPGMLVSFGDDRTVRLWLTNSEGDLSDDQPGKNADRLSKERHDDSRVVEDDKSRKEPAYRNAPPPPVTAPKEAGEVLPPTRVWLNSLLRQ